MVCKNLRALNLSNFYTPNLKDLDDTFTNCYSLEYLDISNFDFDYLKYPERTFNGLDEIKYISIGITNNNEKIIRSLQDSEINDKDQLIICQKQNIIQNPNAIYACCDFTKNQSKCDYNKYITVKYQDMVNYTSGFRNDNITGRNEIYFILNEDSILTNDETFIIEPNNSIDILYLNSNITLEKYFDIDFDENAQEIIYVDLSHFDSSLVTSTKKMFHGCTSINEINLTNFNTLSNEDMPEMFSGCAQLSSLDLSYFDLSIVKNITGIFYGCTSLEYLDISNFNNKSLNNYDDMFTGTDIIKYISLYNVNDSDYIIRAISSTSNLLDKDNLTVCQQKDIINNPKAYYECCVYDDYDFEKLRCDPDNYIAIKFKNDVYYPNGFGFVDEQTQNEYRKGIYFIKYNKIRHSSNESLIIPKGKEVRIVFNSTINSTTKFFYDYLDPNVEHIISIDLSHFNSSLLESSDNMFSGCTSLESIDLSNFNAPLLKNTNNMFFHCELLKIIDLTDFNSTLLTNTNRMFCGCMSLMYLNLNSLDFKKC